MKKLWIAPCAAVVIVACVWTANLVMIGNPTREALGVDSRNEGIDLRARFEWYVIPDKLVLDLRRAENVAATDLVRVLLQTSEILEDREFEFVFLSRNGDKVFRMDGEDFYVLGRAFSRGENPIPLMSELPSLLDFPDGTPAYSQWTGGLLGVMTKRLEDLNDAMRKWSGIDDY